MLKAVEKEVQEATVGVMMAAEVAGEGMRLVKAQERADINESQNQVTIAKIMPESIKDPQSVTP